MSVKQVPTKLIEYMASLKKTYGNKKDEAIKEIEELYKESISLKEVCIQNKDFFKSKCKLSLEDFKVFGGDKYENEYLLSTTKYKLSSYCNNKDEVLIQNLHKLYQFAQILVKIEKLNSVINLSNKILSINRTEYISFMKTYFTKVHEKMILDGYGYAFGQRIGFVCINRVKHEGKRKLIDFAKTKKRKEELLSEGKRLWNKEEALKAKHLGIEYDGVDYRVYKETEYNYEVCLIDNRLPNASEFEFITADTRRNECRGKTNEELLKICKYKPEKIVKLDCDIKTKVNLCTQVDDLLYTKFIRNENQKSYKAGKAYWENR